MFHSSFGGVRVGLKNLVGEWTVKKIEKIVGK